MAVIRVKCVCFCERDIGHKILFFFFSKRELTQLWSKIQKRIDPSLLSLLERCLQLGAIAKTVHHLLYLVRVIQAEVSMNIQTVHM